MKTLHYSIITILLIACGVNVAFAQTSNSTILQYTSIQNSQLHVTVSQGQFVDFPLKISTMPNYEMINVLPLISSWPDDVFATVNSTFLHGVKSANVLVRVYALPTAKPGDYTLPLAAQGWINNTITGNMTMINDESPVPMNVTIMPYKGPVSISLGDMTGAKRVRSCYDNTCLSFTSTEEYQIQVYSQQNTTVRLGAQGLSNEKWVKFMPSILHVGPKGATAKMIVAGIVGSTTTNPLSTKIFEIQAESDNGTIAKTYFPYEENYNLSVLHAVKPINFSDPIVTNVDGSNFGSYGVVYDPDENSSVPVHLSVLGIAQENQTLPLPSWIDTIISQPSFTLNSTQPYFVKIVVKTSSAPVGLHNIAIDETIENKQFVSNLSVVVNEPICIGGPGMCGPQPTPQEKQARTNLNFPFDVTTDSSGNIYVADTSNDRIVKFDPSGNYLMQFGISGKDDGQFMDPRGVAVDDSGNIYVADTENDRIEKFDSGGKFILKFGSHGTDNGQFHGPYVVTADKSGFVYVSDVGNARVQKFDSQGNFILTFGSRGKDNGQFDELGRIAVDGSGYVYVTDITHGIQKFDKSGHFVTMIPLKPTLDGNNTPDAYGIALDNSSNIFVAGDNQARIQKFDPQGNFMYEFGSFGSDAGQFNHPGSIAVDNSGNILVADSDNNRIEKLDPSGKFLSVIHEWNLTDAKNYQQAVPEFPFAVPILLIGIVSVIAFYRMKFRK